MEDQKINQNLYEPKLEDFNTFKEYMDKIICAYWNKKGQDYINEFDIKVKIVRNTQDGMHWHMIDYSEAEAFRVKGFVPNSHSGNWMGPGSKKNIPNGL